METSPCAGLLPLEIGGVSLREVMLGQAVCVMPFKGQDKVVSGRLKAVAGLALPAAGRATGKGGARAIWWGLGATLVVGAETGDLGDVAAVTDQGDGWACVAVRGTTGVDVLARLVPVDLRPATFKKGYVVRTLVGHMAAVIVRIGPDEVQVMVMRSMAGTLVHELATAVRGVAAR